MRTITQFFTKPILLVLGVAFFAKGQHVGSVVMMFFGGMILSLFSLFTDVKQ